MCVKTNVRVKRDTNQKTVCVNRHLQKNHTCQKKRMPETWDSLTVEIFKRDLQKRPVKQTHNRVLLKDQMSYVSKEMCARDFDYFSLRKRPTKETYKRDLQKSLAKETYKRDLQKKPTKETWKETNKRDPQKRPTKKTYLHKRPTKETYKRDLQKKPIHETGTRDPEKRLTKETYKRDQQKRPNNPMKRPLSDVSTETCARHFGSFARQKRPTKETYKRDLQKRPTKETCTWDWRKSGIKRGVWATWCDTRLCCYVMCQQRRVRKRLWLSRSWDL